MWKSKTLLGAILALAPAIWTFIITLYPDWRIVSSEEISDGLAGLVTAVGGILVIIRRLKRQEVINAALSPDPDPEPDGVIYADSDKSNPVQ